MNLNSYYESLGTEMCRAMGLPLRDDVKHKEAYLTAIWRTPKDAEHAKSIVESLPGHLDSEVS